MVNVLPVQVGMHIHKDVDISTENKKQPRKVQVQVLRLENHTMWDQHQFVGKSRSTPRFLGFLGDLICDCIVPIWKGDNQCRGQLVIKSIVPGGKIYHICQSLFPKLCTRVFFLHVQKYLGETKIAVLDMIGSGYEC